MKKFIIDKCMSHIKKNTNYNDTKLKEIEYGLISIYLTFSKMIIISIIATMLNMFTEMMMFSIIYNILRIPSFGLHANKSWICLLLSATLFIGIPYICKFITIPFYIKIFICIFGIYFMFKNSPADTKKKPIINKKKRLIYKYISTTLTVIFAILSFILNINTIINYLIFSIILQNIMISPITYAFFKQPYNNYIKYLKQYSKLTN